MESVERGAWSVNPREAESESAAPDEGSDLCWWHGSPEPCVRVASAERARVPGARRDAPVCAPFDRRLPLAPLSCHVLPVRAVFFHGLRAVISGFAGSEPASWALVSGGSAHGRGRSARVFRRVRCFLLEDEGASHAEGSGSPACAHGMALGDPGGACLRTPRSSAMSRTRFVGRWRVAWRGVGGGVVGAIMVHLHGGGDGLVVPSVFPGGSRGVRAGWVDGGW